MGYGMIGNGRCATHVRRHLVGLVDNFKNVYHWTFTRSQRKRPVGCDEETAAGGASDTG